MQSPQHAHHLPIEIVEKILHYVQYHHRTLASCARVCRFWLPSSRLYLYARMRVGDFKEYPNTTTRSLRGGPEALQLLLESSPSLCDYIQRLDIAWSPGLVVASLRSVVHSLPQLRIMSLWNTSLRRGDKQFLAFEGLWLETTPAGRPALCTRRTWLSLHAEIVTLTADRNTLQLLFDVLGLIETTDTLYLMIGRKLVLDEELQCALRFPSCCHRIQSLEIAFDSLGWFSSRPLGILLGLLSNSRPRSVRCTHWRYPGHAKCLGRLMQQMGAEVEHLHLYFRWFMGEAWAQLNLSHCRQLHTIHFTDFWTWFEIADGQILFDAIRREAPQVRELVFESTMRDLPDKSYDGQPQIQWETIDNLLSSTVQLQRVTVELEAFRPEVRKSLQKLIRARLPKTWKKSLVRFTLDDQEFDLPSSPQSRDENFPSPRSLDAELTRLTL